MSGSGGTYGVKPEKRVTTRCTNAQIKALIRYMKSNKSFANGEYTSVGYQKYIEQWHTVKDLMKDHGPDKSVQQWRYTWRDLKKRAREELTRWKKAKKEGTDLPYLVSQTVEILTILDEADFEEIEESSIVDEFDINEIKPPILDESDIIVTPDIPTTLASSKKSSKPHSPNYSSQSLYSPSPTFSNHSTSPVPTPSCHSPSSPAQTVHIFIPNPNAPTSQSSTGQSTNARQPSGPKLLPRSSDRPQQALLKRTTDFLNVMDTTNNVLKKICNKLDAQSELSRALSEIAHTTNEIARSKIQIAQIQMRRQHHERLRSSRYCFKF